MMERTLPLFFTLLGGCSFHQESQYASTARNAGCMWQKIAEQSSTSSSQEDKRYAVSSANMDLPKWNSTPLVLAGAGCFNNLPRFESRWVQNSGSGSVYCFFWKTHP